jgi:hypothetical protein
MISILLIHFVIIFDATCLVACNLRDQIFTESTLKGILFDGSAKLDAELNDSRPILLYDFAVRFCLKLYFFSSKISIIISFKIVSDQNLLLSLMMQLINLNINLSHLNSRFNKA